VNALEKRVYSLKVVLCSEWEGSTSKKRVVRPLSSISGLMSREEEVDDDGERGDGEFEEEEKS